MEDEVIDQQQTNDDVLEIKYNENENTENDNPADTGETVDTGVQSGATDSNTDSEFESTETEEPEYNEEFEPVNDAAKKIKESVPFVSLRNRYKEAEKERRQLQQRLKEIESANVVQIAQAPEPVEPSLSDFKDIDYDYDDAAKEKAFKKSLADYQNAVKIKAEAVAKLEKQKTALTKWVDEAKQHSDNSFNKIRNKVADFDKLVNNVGSQMTPAQVDMLHLSCKELGVSTGEIVALAGQNKAVLKQIIENHDPIKFSATIAKLNAKLNSTTRKPPVSATNSTSTRTGSSGGAAANMTPEKADELFKAGKLSVEKWRSIQGV